MKVSELIEKLQKMPQDRSIACQVVGQESGVWNMEFDVKNVEHSDWMVQLRVSHPALKHLDMSDWDQP